MDKDSLFWKIADGRLPAPQCAKTLGIEFVDIEPDQGRIVVKCEATEACLNPAGTVQGGFLAAMLDDTMEPALVTTLGASEFAPTVNLKIQFHRPAKVGLLKGIGRVVMRGKEVCQLSGEFLQDDGVVATGTATAVIPRLGVDKA
jgi:uncharacterized protein (TIGR00369 family)